MTMVANARPVVYRPRSCADTYGEPKALFEDRRSALRARRKHRALHQHPYYCKPCDGWHLGHSRIRGRA